MGAVGGQLTGDGEDGVDGGSLGKYLTFCRGAGDNSGRSGTEVVGIEERELGSAISIKTETKVRTKCNSRLSAPRRQISHYHHGRPPGSTATLTSDPDALDAASPALGP